jgi:hypothetical protein
MRFLEKNYKDLIALFILLYCLTALIFKSNIETGLSDTLGYIITGSLGFLFRGKM